MASGSDLKRLTNKISSLESDNQLLTERFASIEVQMQSIQKTSSMESNSRRELSKSLDSLSELVDTLEAKLNNPNPTSTSSSVINPDLQKLKSELEAHQKEFESFRDGQEGRMEILKSSIDKLEASNEKIVMASSLEFRMKDSANLNGFPDSLAELEKVVKGIKEAKEEEIVLRNRKERFAEKEKEKEPSVNTSSIGVEKAVVASNSSANQPQTNQIVCEDLNPTTFEEDLLYFFGSRTGQVSAAEVVKVGSKLNGIVSFNTPQDARKAGENLDGIAFRQRPLSITMMGEKPGSAVEGQTAEAVLARSSPGIRIKQESLSSAPMEVQEAEGEDESITPPRKREETEEEEVVGNESVEVPPLTGTGSARQSPTRLERKEAAIAKMKELKKSNTVGSSNKSGTNGNGDGNDKVEAQAEGESLEAQKAKRDQEEAARNQAIASMKSKRKSSSASGPGTPTESTSASKFSSSSNTTTPSTTTSALEAPLKSSAGKGFPPTGPRASQHNSETFSRSSPSLQNISSSSNNSNSSEPQIFKMKEMANVLGQQVSCYFVNSESQLTLIAIPTYERIKSTPQGKSLQLLNFHTNRKETIGSVIAPLVLGGKRCSSAAEYNQSRKEGCVNINVKASSIKFAVTINKFPSGGIVLGAAALRYLNIEFDQVNNQLAYATDTRMRSGLIPCKDTGFPGIHSGPNGVEILGKRKSKDDWEGNVPLARRLRIDDGSSLSDVGGNGSPNSSVSGSSDSNQPLGLFQRLGGGAGDEMNSTGEGSSNSLLSRIGNNNSNNKRDRESDWDVRDSEERRNQIRSTAEKLDLEKQRSSSGGSRPAVGGGNSRGGADLCRPQSEGGHSRSGSHRAADSYRPSFSNDPGSSTGSNSGRSPYVGGGSDAPQIYSMSIAANHSPSYPSDSRPRNWNQDNNINNNHQSLGLGQHQIAGLGFGEQQQHQKDYDYSIVRHPLAEGEEDPNLNGDVTNPTAEQLAAAQAKSQQIIMDMHAKRRRELSGNGSPSLGNGHPSLPRHPNFNVNNGNSHQMTSHQTHYSKPYLPDSPNRGSR